MRYAIPILVLACNLGVIVLAAGTMDPVLWLYIVASSYYVGWRLTRW